MRHRRHGLCHYLFIGSVSLHRASMNIFQKTCPECAVTNPATAPVCRCGYCFEADVHDDAEEQNRLYRDYLAARITQADAELAVAREQAKADPQNTQKAASALLAQQAVNALRAEMSQLSLHASTRSPTASKRSLPAAPARMRAAQGNTLVAARPKTAAAQTPAARPHPATQHARANSKPAVPPPVSTPGAVIAQKSPVTAKTTVDEQRRAPTVKPDEKFTRLQAQRAEAVTRANKTAAAKRPPPKPVAVQHCPNCTATAAADATRCGCGYTFSRAEEVPALSLDAGALAILTGDTSLSATRRR